MICYRRCSLNYSQISLLDGAVLAYIFLNYDAEFALNIMQKLVQMRCYKVAGTINAQMFSWEGIRICHILPRVLEHLVLDPFNKISNNAFPIKILQILSMQQ